VNGGPPSGQGVVKKLIKGVSYIGVKTSTRSLSRGKNPINPGDEKSESIPVTFGENIELGDYTLIATRTFTLNDRYLRLNPIQ
jgi:hypothetical protein